MSLGIDLQNKKKKENPPEKKQLTTETEHTGRPMVILCLEREAGVRPGDKKPAPESCL